MTTNTSGVTYFKSSLKFRFMISILVFLQAVCGATITKIQSDNDTIDWSSVQGDDVFHFLDNNTLIEIIDVAEQPQNFSGNLPSKRICRGNTVSYKQYQLVQHGTWWSAWERTSASDHCSSTPFNRNIDWTIGYDIPISAGISFSKVADLMLGAGVSIVKSFKTSTGMGCSCQGSEKVCIWEQSRLTWSDTQVQTCTR